MVLSRLTDDRRKVFAIANAAFTKLRGQNGILFRFDSRQSFVTITDEFRVTFSVDAKSISIAYTRPKVCMRNHTQQCDSIHGSAAHDVM